jgi:urease subunit alpha
MFGAYGRAVAPSGVTIVSAAAVRLDVGASLGLERELVAVKDTRKIGKRSMILNDALPEMAVDPETYEVRANGELLTCEPASVLPMAQRYFLY